MTLTIFSGCSSHFDRYTLSSEEERATGSYQTIRLLDSKNRTRTVLSTIYLNEVYPDYAGGYAHFLVAFYSLEEKRELYFDSNATRTKRDYLLRLNGRDALVAQALDNDDLMVGLMPVKSSWNRYYYVRYALPSGTPVLVLESDHTEQAAITYQKEKE